MCRIHNCIRTTVLMPRILSMMRRCINEQGSEKFTTSLSLHRLRCWRSPQMRRRWPRRDVCPWKGGINDVGGSWSEGCISSGDGCRASVQTQNLYKQRRINTQFVYWCIRMRDFVLRSCPRTWFTQSVGRAQLFDWNSHLWYKTTIHGSSSGRCGSSPN